MKTDLLIQTLAAGLPPVTPLPSPTARLGRWLVLSAPVLAGVVLLFGLRADITERLAEPGFVIGILAALATGLTAAWAALSSTVPGIPAIRQWLPALPAAAWLSVIGEGCWREWLHLGGASLDGLATPQCFPEIIAVGTVPAILLVWLARKGASLHPQRTAALSALAAAALGSAVLELFHRQEAAMIALVWHFGAVALMSLVSAWAGRRLFRGL
jgi:hypothetical protein